MKHLSEKNKYLFLLWGILLVAIFATFLHQGSVLIDCGREAYYPSQILAGKVLYKDLFNIYGPFSYLYNAFLFKIFGANLNILFISGCISSFIIVSTLYLISRKFLSNVLSFSICVFTVIIGVYNVWIFNYIFPYSFGILYGFTAFVLGIYFLLNYTSVRRKETDLYLSMLFAGICIANKYEFLPVFLVLLIVPFLFKAKLKSILISYFWAFLIPILCFSFLAIQGLKVDDLITSFDYLFKMSETQTLNYFYKSQGIYPSIQSISFTFVSFIKTVIPFVMFILGFNLKNRFLSITSITAATILACMTINPASFTFLPLLVLIVAFLRVKELKNSIALCLLLFSGLFYSLKVYWGITTQTYGVFFLPFLLVILFALIFSSQKIKQGYQTHAAIYLLLISFIFGFYLHNNILAKSHIIKTSKGTIYESENIAKSTNELIKYIQKQTNPQAKVLILPEGMMINFLTDRKTDDYYNSFIPLYVETFGEEKLIERLKEERPEYVVFNNWSTKDYYFEYICKDYAVSFCNQVAQDYDHVKTIDSGFRYLIYKIKN